MLIPGIMVQRIKMFQRMKRIIIDSCNLKKVRNRDVLHLLLC